MTQTRPIFTTHSIPVIIVLEGGWVQNVYSPSESNLEFMRKLRKEFGQQFCGRCSCCTLLIDIQRK